MVKNLPGNTGNVGSIPGSRRSPGGGIGYLLQYWAWEIHGQRSLVGYSPQSHKKSDATELLNNNNDDRN